jgi:hypothetical protein
MLYLNQTFGDPVATFRAQAGWRQPISLQSFLNDIGFLLEGKLYPSYIMDMVVFFIVMALIVPIARRFGAGYAAYTAISLLIPASTGVVNLTRYAIPLFPIFMFLGLWIRNTWIDRTVRTVFLVFLLLFALAFVKNVYIG